MPEIEPPVLHEASYHQLLGVVGTLRTMLDHQMSPTLVDHIIHESLANSERHVEHHG